eukprot:Sdes_comp20746_c0_seq1m16635
MASESVKVVVRNRPLNEKEKKEQSFDVIQMDMESGQISILTGTSGETLKSNEKSGEKNPDKTFTFDAVYTGAVDNIEIYEEVGFSLIESVLEGFNGTMFAYGQTGCGKTFTMEGNRAPKSQRGIILQAFDHIFEKIPLMRNKKFLVHASYLEIYNEEIRDLLLSPSLMKGAHKLDIRESPEKGVYVHQLSHHIVQDAKQTDALLQRGAQFRHTGSTLMNAASSRSHSIFSIQVESEEGAGKVVRRVGKLNLVDLAGSERQSKTGATGDRLKEATKINLSLSCLGNVISALVDGKSKHIPYRDSKLTRLLQDSLGGNMKTVMIACISPASSNADETLSTLRYANRAKNIQNKPKQNMDAKDALIAQYLKEIERLKELLGRKMEGVEGVGVVSGDGARQVEGGEREVVEDAEGRRGDDLEEDLRRKFAELAEVYGAKVEKSGVDVKARKSAEEEFRLEREKWLREKLESLQENVVIGGKQANDLRAVSEFEEKQQKIYAKIRNRKERMKELLKDEENFEEAMYTNLSEQVEDRNRKLRKMKNSLDELKNEHAQELEKISKEKLQICSQLKESEKQKAFLLAFLDKVVPLLRRDCNYYSFERIRAQSRYDESEKAWILPRIQCGEKSDEVVLEREEKRAQMVAESPQKSGKIREDENVYQDDFEDDEEEEKAGKTPEKNQNLPQKIIPRNLKPLQNSIKHSTKIAA